jgi:hypothetical protein
MPHFAAHPRRGVGTDALPAGFIFYPGSLDLCSTLGYFSSRFFNSNKNKTTVKHGISET